MLLDVDLHLHHLRGKLSGLCLDVEENGIDHHLILIAIEGDHIHIGAICLHQIDHPQQFRVCPLPRELGVLLLGFVVCHDDLEVEVNSKLSVALLLGRIPHKET